MHRRELINIMMIMKLKEINPKKILLILFVAIVTTKLALIPFISGPIIMLDESLYTLMMRSIWHTGSYFTDMVYGMQYPPLYPILLSPVAVFGNVLSSYKAVLVLNALVSSTVIYPAFWLANEWLDDVDSLKVALLVGVMPATFIYTFTAMSENLFIPLFLGSVYFIKKCVDDDSFKNNALAGLLISCTVLTKMIGMVLVIVYVMVVIWNTMKNSTDTRNSCKSA